MQVEIRAEAFADETLPILPGHQANYYGWDLYVSVGARTYSARRYKDADDVPFFHFSDPPRGPKDWRPRSGRTTPMCSTPPRVRCSHYRVFGD